MNSPIQRAVRRALSPLALATLVGAGLSGGALAQESADDGAIALQEIVVTAQFREQRLQDTPIAITAVSAELLEARNQTSLTEVAAQAPNVTLTETGGAFGPGIAPRIRGVGQGDYVAALEPGVGLYIDDVYYPSLTGANFDLLDLERVEILRGPQGTLAGRNSIGGAVKMFSQKPTGDGSGNVRATYGSRSLLDLRAVGDFTLLEDSLFLRVSGVSRKQDGYVKRMDYGCVFPGNGEVPNRTEHGECLLGMEGGRDYSAGRAALRWLASDTVEVNLAADVTLDRSEVAANTLIATGPITPGILIGTIPFDSRYIPDSPYVSYASFYNERPDGTTVYFEPKTSAKVWGTNLTVDWNFSDSAALKSITAYREFDARWAEDNDASPAYLGLGAEHQTNHSFSQELRLTGRFGEAFDYAVGAYYFDQTTIGRTHQMLNYAIPGMLFEFLGNDPTDASSYAGFANGTWHITDALNLNVGLRYTDEEKSYTFSRRTPDGGIAPIVGNLTGVTGFYEGSKWDYRVNVDYRWTPQLMTYASVSTGFKGGGVNPRPFNVAQVQSFNPEELTAYEIGAKTDFFDRRLRLNLSGFLNKYKDIQVSLASCPQFGGPGPCALPANAGNADIEGVELEAEIRPIDGLSIDASYSMLDFEYTWLDPATGIPVGAKAPGIVERQWSIGAQYEFLLASGASITPRFDYSYKGGFETLAEPTASSMTPGYHLANARITWRSSDDEWQASLTASNLFDKLYYHSVFDLTSRAGGSNYAHVAPPREFSIQVQKKF